MQSRGAATGAVMACCLPRLLHVAKPNCRSHPGSGKKRQAQQTPQKSCLVSGCSTQAQHELCITMHFNACAQAKARKRRMPRWPRGNELQSSLDLCQSLLGWVSDAQTVVYC